MKDDPALAGIVFEGDSGKIHPNVFLRSDNGGGADNTLQLSP